MAVSTDTEDLDFAMVPPGGAEAPGVLCSRVSFRLPAALKREVRLSFMTPKSLSPNSASLWPWEVAAVQRGLKRSYSPQRTRASQGVLSCEVAADLNHLEKKVKATSTAQQDAQQTGKSGKNLGGEGLRQEQG